MTKFPYQHSIQELTQNDSELIDSLRRYGLILSNEISRLPFPTASEANLNEISVSQLGCTTKIIDHNFDQISNISCTENSLVLPGSQKITRLGLGLFGLGQFVETMVNDALNTSGKDGIAIVFDDLKDPEFISHSYIPLQQIEKVDPANEQHLTTISYAMAIAIFNRLDIRALVLEWLLIVLKSRKHRDFFIQRSHKIGETISSQRSLEKYAFDYGEVTACDTDEARWRNYYHIHYMAYYISLMYSV